MACIKKNMMTNLHENVETLMVNDYMSMLKNICIVNTDLREHVEKHGKDTDLHEHVEEHGDPAAGRHCYVQQHVLPKICFENIVMHVLYFDAVDI